MVKKKKRVPKTVKTTANTTVSAITGTKGKGLTNQQYNARLRQAIKADQKVSLQKGGNVGKIAASAVAGSAINSATSSRKENNSNNDALIESGVQQTTRGTDEDDSTSVEGRFYV